MIGHTMMPTQTASLIQKKVLLARNIAVVYTPSFRRVLASQATLVAVIPQMKQQMTERYAAQRRLLVLLKGLGRISCYQIKRNGCLSKKKKMILSQKIFFFFVIHKRQAW